jgi:hypothetical protein
VRDSKLAIGLLLLSVACGKDDEGVEPPTDFRFPVGVVVQGNVADSEGHALSSAQVIVTAYMLVQQDSPARDSCLGPTLVSATPPVSSDGTFGQTFTITAFELDACVLVRASVGQVSTSKVISPARFRDARTGAPRDTVRTSVVLPR